MIKVTCIHQNASAGANHKIAKEIFCTCIGGEVGINAEWRGPGSFRTNGTSKPHQKIPGSRVIYTHQNARSGARQNSAGGEWHLRRFWGRSQRARGQQGGRLDSSAWAGRHLPTLEKGVHVLGQCVGPHSERRRRRFRRFRARGAAAAGCGGGGAAVLRLSQNFPPLAQKI